MRIHFAHHTRYRYSQAVELLPQLIRLRPREDAFQKLQSYQCVVSPALGQAPLLDAEGNSVIQAWFQGSTKQMDIQTKGVVETFRDNPYDFVLDPEAMSLPLKGPGARHPALLACLALAGPAQKKTKDLSASLLAASKGSSLAYLNLALSQVSASLKRVVRDDGDAWGAEETLRQGQGSCRDMAVLFMELCRLQGLPARFVSGYYLEQPGRKDHDLHAWAELYLPGAGWRGFDPSNALACASSHIALCAGARAQDCAPVSGSFSGSGKAELSVSLELKA